MAYIEFKNVSKDYINKEVKKRALKKINFEIEKGELVIITGPSGTGKTTCLNILATIDKATLGTVLVDNINITKLKERKSTIYRRDNIGFIFQDYNLIQNLTVKENIELGVKDNKDSMNVLDIIKKLGLTKIMENFPFELSKEEQQLVAIARALVKKPKLLLCDEPILALEDKKTKKVLKLLQSMTKKEQSTVIIVTRNNNIIPIANRVISFKNKSVNDIKINKKPTSVGDLKW